MITFVDTGVLLDECGISVKIVDTPDLPIFAENMPQLIESWKMLLEEDITCPGGSFPADDMRNALFQLRIITIKDSCDAWRRNHKQKLLDDDAGL